MFFGLLVIGPDDFIDSDSGVYHVGRNGSLYKCRAFEILILIWGFRTQNCSAVTKVQN